MCVANMFVCGMGHERSECMKVGECSDVTLLDNVVT